MEVRLSVAVVHAPWVKQRRECVEALELALAPHVPFAVVADHNRDGVWPTAARAWRRHDTTATHHLVLQDDVVLCDGFLGHVRAGLAATVYRPTGYYSSARAVEKQRAVARAQGSAWMPLLGATCGVALCLPVPFIAPFLCWTWGRIDAGYTLGDDVRLALFLLERQIPTYWTTENLVQHVGEPSFGGVSLLGHKYRPKTHTPPPAEIDWSVCSSAPVSVCSFAQLVRENRIPLRNTGAPNVV